MLGFKITKREIRDIYWFFMISSLKKEWFYDWLNAYDKDLATCFKKYIRKIK